MTMLHAGGSSADAYKVSGGLHGVGVSVSTRSGGLEVEGRWRDGSSTASASRGAKVTQLRPSARTRAGGPATVSFKPDPEIFTELTFDFETLSTRLRDGV